tara:strand:+ start:307 stop:537 length:231 start_codon:yes stop_codon:yes gene_type:complete
MDIKQINKRSAYIKIDDVYFYIDYTLEKPIIDSWKEGDEIKVKEVEGGFIPKEPHRAYIDEFKGWADFLGVKQRKQ